MAESSAYVRNERGWIPERWMTRMDDATRTLGCFRFSLISRNEEPRLSFARLLVIGRAWSTAPCVVG